MTDKITACFLCPCNCGLIMTLDDSGKITQIRGDKENPRTKGFICNKGVNLADHIDSPHRLKAPLKRKEDRLVETSWDEALAGVAEGISRIKGAHGPRSIAMALGGSPHPTVMNIIGYQFLRSLGSRNMYSPISLEFTSRYLANQKMFGCSFLEGHPDIHNAKYVLMIGTNPIMSHPLWTKPLKELSKDPERTLIVVDPRFTETARLADLYTSILPSTDIYFLLALLNVLLSNGLHEKETAGRYAVGLEDVQKSVSRFTPEAVSKITGIEAKAIEEIAVRYVKEKPAIIHYDMGVIANRHSTLLSWAVKTLTLINGGMGVKGGLLFNPTLTNFNQSERISYAGKKYSSRIRGYHEITGHLPITVLQDEILTPGPGRIRAMIVGSCNPLRTYTNAAKMEKAFKDLEFLVSIDPFLTEVGRLADYVLPACSFHEQDNVSFQFHHMYPARFVQLTRKIREPLGNSRPEWMIYRDLSKRLGVNFLNNALADLVFKAADGIKSLLGKAGGVNRQEILLRLLARLGGTSWAELVVRSHGFDLDAGKSREMLAEIRTPGGKARLNVPDFLSAVDGLPLAPPVRDPEYPFILSTTCRTPANVNTLYRNEKWVAKHMPENSLTMHPEDAYAADLSEESRVRVSSRTGEVESALTISRDVLPGTIYLQGGWGIYSRDPKDTSGKLRGTPAAMLLPDEEGDAFTGMPLLSGVSCKVEKISG